MTAKVNRLGAKAIRMSSGPDAREPGPRGEFFSEGLGIGYSLGAPAREDREDAGALGPARTWSVTRFHAVVMEGDVKRVASSLRSDKLSPEVAVYTLAAGPAVNLD